MGIEHYRESQKSGSRHVYLVFVHSVQCAMPFSPRFNKLGIFPVYRAEIDVPTTLAWM